MLKLIFMPKILLLLLAAICAQQITYSQNVGINADGSTPNTNAMLDIKSSTKGVLIPRTSTTSRTAIPNTKGLLVYDTTTNSFWYNDGAAWQQMSNGAGTLNGTTNYLPKFTGTTTVGNSQMVDNGQYVGIGTITPTAGLNIIHNGGIIAKGDTLSKNNYSLTETGTGAKFIWHPKKGAMRAGFIDNGFGFLWDDQYIGNWSIGLGYNEYVPGLGAVGAGFQTSSMGSYSFSSGSNTMATRIASTAMGNNSKAEGDYSFAVGNGTTAIGVSSVAMGFGTATQGDYSFALGNNCYSGGAASMAMGENVQATGSVSVAFGYATLAAGDYSFAANASTKANGQTSVAMGNGSVAGGTASFAVGALSNASGLASVAMGRESSASGESSIATGYHSTAGGIYSLAHGNFAVATGSTSIAIGSNITASGNNTMIFGYNLFDAGHKGDLMMGDTDPWNAGQVGSGTDDQMICRFNNGYYFLTGGNTNRTGVYATHGDNSWSVISDSTKKEKIILVDGEVLLNKIAKFKLGTWNYKGQDSKTFRHYGPMAQDFHNAFGRDALGSIGCDTLINQADFLGVSFTAIQALEKRTAKIEMQQKQIVDLQKQNETLVANNEKLQLQLQNMLAMLSAINKKVDVLASVKNNNNSSDIATTATLNH
jgi:Head domain of trimeric autotransporter adhesin/Chaperone of endosialidase